MALKYRYLDATYQHIRRLSDGAIIPCVANSIDYVEALASGVDDPIVDDITYIDPNKPASKSAEERIAQLEQALETAQNEIGTLKALWQAE